MTYAVYLPPMTDFPPRGPLTREARLALASVMLLGLGACRDAGPRPPRAEFIVAAGDSTYWVRSEPSGIRLRGSPMVLARLDNKFLELYVVDDDRSFENALFVGQRLFQRDLITGDSSEIFRDTLVMALAERYARAHPDARRLAPDEDAAEEPATDASAEVSVLGVHGPFLSLEYHVDTAAGNETWHQTRHQVIDLRTGRAATLADVLGPSEAAGVLSRGRKLYQETVDSVRRDKRPAAQRAAAAITHFRFDPSSFSIAAPSGSLMIAFSAPGQGTGGEGFVLPMRPIAVTEPAWWADVRGALPTSTREREERWARPGYEVRAVYDTSARPVRLAIADSAGKEYEIGGVSAPVHRIYWLDAPAIGKSDRDALTKAFDEAAHYDEGTRTATRTLGPRIVLAVARR